MFHINFRPLERDLPGIGIASSDEFFYVADGVIYDGQFVFRFSDSQTADVLGTPADLCRFPFQHVDQIPLIDRNVRTLPGPVKVFAAEPHSPYAALKQMPYIINE